jgi:hypothetical protein
LTLIPNPAIEDAPKKRKKSASKLNTKTLTSQQDDDEDGPSAVNSQQPKRDASGVLKKKVKLTPVIPSIANSEDGSSSDDADQRVFKNITLDK